MADGEIISADDTKPDEQVPVQTIEVAADQDMDALPAEQVQIVVTQTVKTQTVTSISALNLQIALNNNRMDESNRIIAQHQQNIETYTQANKDLQAQVDQFNDAINEVKK